MVASRNSKGVGYNAHDINGFGSSAKTDRRCRLNHNFWLDLAKDGEYWLAEQIALLKRERAYSRAVRDGLRLFLDLRQGSMAVLFELFPWIRTELDNRIKDAIIEHQAALLRSMSAPVPANIVPMPSAAAPRPLAVPSAPDEDLPELVVTKAKSDGKSALNFIDSAFSLQTIQ